MRRHGSIFVALALCASLLTAQAAKPATTATKPPPGVDLAQTISMVTGVAISPLLGVGAVGAWKFAHTPEAQRAQLPWFAQPAFFVPALLLVVLVFIKDAGGTMVPTALKKPLDVAEAVENKISGLVATGAFVPMIVSVYHSDFATEASLSAAGFAAVDPSPFYNALMVPVAMVAFAMVWLVSHAINMLILISPFSTVDAALKAFRTLLLSSVAITSFANPYVGAIWALVIILICYFLAGWAFRLMIFGSTFIWDFLTFRRSRFSPDSKENWMFLARETDKVPIRTYGRLVKNDQGELVFHYRRWLVLPSRELKLAQAQYAVGRGFICSEVVRVEGENHHAVMLLPPRYKTHEEELSRIYGLAGVVDVGIIAGLKAFWRPVKELFGFKAAAA